MRFRREVFAALEGAHGPFTEMIGAERAFARRPSDAGGAVKIWAHPTYDTVGSALGRIGERLDPDSSSCATGLIVVPWAPEATWWPMLKHFTCVARFGVNSKHLEENRSGRWVNVSARRPSLVMSFPAHPGTVVPLDALVATREDEEEEPIVGSAKVLRGNLLYSPRAVPDAEAIDGGEHGCLYILLEDYDGRGAPACAEMLRMERRPGDEGMKFHCDMGSRQRRGASLDVGGRPYRPFASELWVANHFSSEQRAAPGASGLWSRVHFDFESAEREIRMRRNALNMQIVTDELRGSAISDELKASMRSLLENEERDREEPMSGLDARPEPGQASGAEGERFVLLRS